jgi:hypothetical protein
MGFSAHKLSRRDTVNLLATDVPDMARVSINHIVFAVYCILLSFSILSQHGVSILFSCIACFASGSTFNLRVGL